MKKIMMKSIEERAYKKSLELFKPKANVTTKELLIEMAKEQEQITKQEMINKAKEAYCKASRCGVPRDTCLRLGTCDKYDNFVRML